MWKGFQTFTNHKLTKQTLLSSHAFVPDELRRPGFDVMPEMLTPPQLIVQYHSPLQRSSPLSRVDTWRSAGPNGIPGSVLRICADQLAQVFPGILNQSLATVPTCLKIRTLVPVPKPSCQKECLSDFHHVSLTHIVKKHFEKLVLSHLITRLPPPLDPQQSHPHCLNRSKPFLLHVIQPTHTWITPPHTSGMTSALHFHYTDLPKRNDPLPHSLREVDVHLLLKNRLVWFWPF